MKFATFRRAAESTDAAPARYGVVFDGDVIDLVEADRLRCEAGAKSLALPAMLKEAVALFHRDRRPVDELVAWLLENGADAGPARLPLNETRLLPPVLSPDKFICVGKNNRAHLEELKRNSLIKELPQEPTGFVKVASSLVGHDAEVARPEGIVQFDYEPELVFVIGKPAYRVPKEEAMDYVFGLALLNDLTAREVQRREVASGTRFWTAKNMPGFGPVGPFLVTLDEVADPQDLWITCTVNGRERIRVNTGEQIYQIPDIIEHFSRHVQLFPGDMFSTGSPGGVAVGSSNPEELYLKPGDVVDVTMEGVMTLRTCIVG